MHYILFEGTGETRRHARGGSGLDVRGGDALCGLAAGDVLWIVTRMDENRQTPALCARLVVHRVLTHLAAEPGYDALQSDRTHRLQADRGRSQRCAPFACPMIINWDIWRKPFGGLLPVADEQRLALEQEWNNSPREGR